MKYELKSYEFTGHCKAIFFDGSQESAEAVGKVLPSVQAEYMPEARAVLLTRCRMMKGQMTFQGQRIATADTYLIATNPSDYRPCKVYTKAKFEGEYKPVENFLGANSQARSVYQCSDPEKSESGLIEIN